MLPENKAAVIASRRPRTAPPFPPCSAASPPSFLRPRLLSRCDGPGTPPGGHSRQRRSRQPSRESRLMQRMRRQGHQVPSRHPLPLSASTCGGGAVVQGSLTNSGPSVALFLSACILRSQVLSPPSQSWGHQRMLSFSFHIWATKKGNLARKNQVLAGASGCWGEKQSRQGHWGLFSVPASQAELGNMYLLNLGLKH